MYRITKPVSLAIDVIESMECDMSLTIPEICERLTQIDEVLLLELLEINSEDIVAKFQDRIERKADELEEQVI